jgi:purine-nucleoside phosphorylase
LYYLNLTLNRTYAEEDMAMYEHISEAAAFIKERHEAVPEIGIILGSGLGVFADTAADKTAISYQEIPYFKKVSVVGHAGKLILGTVGSRRVAILQGRYHYYEGHDIGDVVFPVRVLCRLGIKKLIITNAAGGISPMLEPGDLMLIRDHINLMGVNPLRGANDERLGDRFPDMSEAYNRQMRETVAEGMRKLGMGVKRGVYVALSGPSYETPAEIKMFAAMGADAVGMSTVPEVIAARHMGVTVAGISCISNLAAGISPTPLSHREVTETADRVKDRFIDLLNTTVPQL